MSITVQVLPDGPLRVCGAEQIQVFGEARAVEGDLYLCRCGQSANAPYCDGSHRRAGFVGVSEAPPAAELRVWEGRTVRTRFNTAACMHVFTCKPLKELRARELAGDDAAAAELLRVVDACPSGALTAERVDGGPLPEAPGPALEVVEGGEVRLRGAFGIDQPLQEGQPATRATLCRCGESKNKPWCDGRHRGRRDFR